MAIAEPIPQRTDERKIARMAALLRVGHEGVMLDGVQRKAAHVLNLAKWAASGSEEGMPAAQDDDMAVNIGNEIHYHQTSENTIGTAAKRTAPLLLAAAAGVVGVLAYNYFTSEPQSPPVVVQPADPQAWQIGLEVKDEP